MMSLPSLAKPEAPTKYTPLKLLLPLSVLALQFVEAKYSVFNSTCPFWLKLAMVKADSPPVTLPPPLPDAPVVVVDVPCAVMKQFVSQLPISCGAAVLASAAGAATLLSPPLLLHACRSTLAAIDNVVEIFLVFIVVCTIKMRRVFVVLHVMIV